MQQVKRGDIFFANLNPVIGSEQGGTRPVLVLQNNHGNKYSPTVVVAAITAKQNKADIPTHIKLECDVLHKESIVLLEQIRTIDKTRLENYIGKLDSADMKKVNKAIQISMGIVEGYNE